MKTCHNLFTLMLFQTHMTFVFPMEQKKVYASMIFPYNYGFQTSKKDVKVVHMHCKLL